jgi:hypothetical protein
MNVFKTVLDKRDEVLGSGRNDVNAQASMSIVSLPETPVRRRRPKGFVTVCLHCRHSAMKSELMTCCKCGQSDLDPRDHRTEMKGAL